MKETKANRRKRRLRLNLRMRDKLSRPRLSVFCSSRHTYAQIIDDTKGFTLAASSSKGLKLENGGNVEAAKQVGSAIAKAAKEAGVTKVLFDRGDKRYHGRIAALAEEARTELEF